MGTPGTATFARSQSTSSSASQWGDGALFKLGASLSLRRQREQRGLRGLWGPGLRFGIRFSVLWTGSDQISRSAVSHSLRPHESQHARPPCPSPTPGVHSDSGPSSQWCHPAISSSVVAFSSCPNPSQHQSLFQWVNSSHEVAKVLEFQLQHQSFQRNYRADLQNGLVGSPCSPRDSQESSPTPQFKSINYSALSFLYSPTLTSVHDHWKNHSLDYTDLCWKSNVSAFEYAI